MHKFINFLPGQGLGPSPRLGGRSGPGQELFTRAVSAPATPENLRWILATETPARVFDWQRGEVVLEVLQMEGARWPALGQVPLLDSHSRYTIEDLLGSVAEFRATTAGQGEALVPALEGLVRFAEDERSQRAQAKVRGGHLTDGSVGYQVVAAVWIPEGTRATVRGRSYQGPVKVSTDWIIKEFSLTPIGADGLSKKK